MSERLKVYYDGQCRVCDGEICHYRKRKGSESIEFVDISHPAFDPAAHGLDPGAIHREMHVKLPSGTVLTGVAGFREIWKTLPFYRKFVGLSRFPPVDWLLRAGYQIFIRIRPYLPRKS